MYQIILLFHVFAAVCIIALVLVQQGKGATMGAGFGSGASQTVFGSRGSGSFLFRITASFVAVFFLTSIGLNYMASQAVRREKVIMLPPAQQQEMPATGSDAKTVPVAPLQSPTLPTDIPARGK